MVVELRHGAYRGATGAHGVGLVDGNGRRHALYFVHRRFVHAVHELASIGREGFHITALAFSVQCVKHQAGLAGAAGACHHGQFAGADVQIQVLQIVLARAADANGSLGHVAVSFWMKPDILGTNCTDPGCKGKPAATLLGTVGPADR